MPKDTSKNEHSSLDLDSLPLLGKLPKAERHAYYAQYAGRNQYYAVEKVRGKGRLAKCRECMKVIEPGTVRLRHLVCNNKCHNTKNKDVKDICGRWHIECLLKAQKSNADRFLASHGEWKGVDSTSNLAGFKNLEPEDQATVESYFNA